MTDLPSWAQDQLRAADRTAAFARTLSTKGWRIAALAALVGSVPYYFLSGHKWAFAAFMFGGGILFFRLTIKLAATQAAKTAEGIRDSVAALTHGRPEGRAPLE